MGFFYVPAKKRKRNLVYLVLRCRHKKYAMFAAANVSGEELVWFSPATTSDVIQIQLLKVGSEIIVKLPGKNKVEPSILGKATELEHDSRSADNLKGLMIKSMKEAS